MQKRCMGCMEVYEDSYGVCPHCGFIEGSKPEEAIHLTPGTELAGRYTIGKVIGYGSFGVTYIGWDNLLEQKVALKEYFPSEFSTRMPGVSTVSIFSGDKKQQFQDGLGKFVEEARHLAKFQDEAGIVKIYDSFETNETAYIVMEYLEGETLAARLKREGTIPEKEAVEMLMPVMESLNTVHAEGLLHRDIAPDNIFITKDGQVKLIDFGASRYATTSHSRSLTVIIKPGYSPEEQYRSRGDQGTYTDVYALGATLYKMITGVTPPDAMERRVSYETKSKDILVEPHRLKKKISPITEVALLNAMNVRIEDRTQDIVGLVGELQSEVPAKRKQGKIKKIDLYRMPLWMKIVIPSVMAAVMTLVILLSTGVIDFNVFSSEIILPEGTVIVPYVEGKQNREAIEEIEGNGLLAKTAGTIESEYIEAGIIIVQSPSGGAYAEENTGVYLTVCSGKEVEGAKDGIAIVPYVQWDTEENALRKLKQAGLGDPIIKEEYDENVEKGSVISQSIEFGTEVPEGTIIELVISKGPAPFGMPSVVGQTAESAIAELKALGLMVTLEYRNDMTAEANRVLEQSVQAATEVVRGDEVVLVISVREETIAVPEIVGQQRGDAERTLKGAGFNVTVLENYDNTIAAGTVMSQSPAGGSAQRRGTTIVIYVSKGKMEEQSSAANEESAGSVPSRTDNTSNQGNNSSTVNNGTSSTNGSTNSSVSSSTVTEESSKKTTMFYMISLDDNTTVTTMKVIGGSAVGALPVPAGREGYTFSGWYNEAKVQLTEGMVLAKSDDTTFTDENGNPGKELYYWAKWDPKEYIVNLELDGGTADTTFKNVFYTSTYAETLYTVGVSRPWYTFDGWYTSDGVRLSEGSQYLYDGDMTAYAHWTPINMQLQLQYLLAGSSSGGPSTTLDMTIGSTVSYTPPYIEGYLQPETFYFTATEDALNGLTLVSSGETYVYQWNGTLNYVTAVPATADYFWHATTKSIESDASQGELDCNWSIQCVGRTATTATLKVVITDYLWKGCYWNSDMGFAMRCSGSSVGSCSGEKFVLVPVGYFSKENRIAAGSGAETVYHEEYITISGLDSSTEGTFTLTYNTFYPRSDGSESQMSDRNFTFDIPRYI